jgi:hypothetical protein
VRPDRAGIIGLSLDDLTADIVEEQGHTDERARHGLGWLLERWCH